LAKAFKEALATYVTAANPTTDVALPAMPTKVTKAQYFDGNETLAQYGLPGTDEQQYDYASSSLFYLERLREGLDQKLPVVEDHSSSIQMQSHLMSSSRPGHHFRF
jgi:hypothetical protein